MCSDADHLAGELSRPQLSGEHVGTEVEKVMPIASKDEVWDVVLVAWDTVPQQQVGKLVHSFPKGVTTLLGRYGMKIQKSAKIWFRVEVPSSWSESSVFWKILKFCFKMTPSSLT